MSTQADFEPLLFSILGPYLHEQGFKRVDRSTTGWYFEFNNSRCVIRLIYDYGYVGCQFVDPVIWSERVNLVINNAPAGYPCYFIHHVYRYYYPEDDLMSKANPYDLIENQFTLIRLVLSEKLQHVVDGDFSWVGKFR